MFNPPIDFYPVVGEWIAITSRLNLVRATALPRLSPPLASCVAESANVPRTARLNCKEKIMLRAFAANGHGLSLLRRGGMVGARKTTHSRRAESLPARGTAGFALAIVLVLTGAFFYDRYSTWIYRQLVQIEQQREALRQLENLEAGLSDAATAARGFVLSAEPVHVNDYRLAAAATRERLTAMERQERTSGSPGDLLLRQAWGYLDSLDEMVHSVERRGGTSARQQTVLSVDVASKAAIDSLINVRRTEFADALIAQRDVLNGELRRGRFVNWIAAGAAAIFLIAFWTLLRHAFRQRQRAAAALATLNASLEETVRRRTAELTELSQHLLSVRDEERAALAREIHDEIGSEIMVVRMECDRLQMMRTNDNPTAEASWSRIKHALGELTIAHRRIINALHPTVLDHLGLEPAIRGLLKDSLQPAGLQYELFVDGCVDDLQPAIGIAAYRVVQEAITNVLKHARAKSATVALVRNSTALTVQVTDDGVGCASRSMEKGRLGVVGMRERAHQLGGSFNIEPGPGAIGTRVTARFALAGLQRGPQPPRGGEADVERNRLLEAGSGEEQVGALRRFPRCEMGAD